MKPIFSIYITLLLIGLIIALGSLICCEKLANAAADRPGRNARVRVPQEFTYQVVPASDHANAPGQANLARPAVRPLARPGVHMILYTRVEADPQGNPVLRGYRLRLTWDQLHVPALGVSGSPLPTRDMAAPF